MFERVYVTGAAGFIGAHVCDALARRGVSVAGCDRMAHDTPPALREGRVAALLKPAGVALDVFDVADTGRLERALRRHRADVVLHLAARPGVRRSAEIPVDYTRDNVLAFVSVLEACRLAGTARVVYASSSSVYGNRTGIFEESAVLAPPASIYAATKQADEAIALAYRAQLGLHGLGLRLFTVYGPWGRPDMAAYLFAQSIRRGLPIKVFGNGEPWRDFTFIGDVVHAICALVTRAAQPYDSPVVNIGHQQPVPVIELVRALERATGRSAIVRHEPLPPGDVAHTCADDRLLRSMIGVWPTTPLQEGVDALVRWLEAWNPLPSRAISTCL